MHSDGASSREAITAALDDLDAVFEKLAALSFDVLTAREALGVQERLERHRRTQPAVEHRLVYQLISQATAADLGGKNWSDVLAQRLSLSGGEARRRLDEAADLGP